MRKIKFRGRRIDNGEWITGNLVWMHATRGGWITGIQMQTGDGYRPWASINVDPETVGEYTGLKDMNDKEIYEGDVVKVSDPDKKHQIQEIRFTDGAFCGYSDKKECKYTFLEVLKKAHGVEVIGNIYEHPELVVVAAI